MKDFERLVHSLDKNQQSFKKVFLSDPRLDKNAIEKLYANTFYERFLAPKMLKINQSKS